MMEAALPSPRAVAQEELVPSASQEAFMQVAQANGWDAQAFEAFGGESPDAPDSSVPHPSGNKRKSQIFRDAGWDIESLALAIDTPPQTDKDSCTQTDQQAGEGAGDSPGNEEVAGWDLTALLQAVDLTPPEKENVNPQPRPNQLPPAASIKSTFKGPAVSSSAANHTCGSAALKSRVARVGLADAAREGITVNIGRPSPHDTVLERQVQEVNTCDTGQLEAACKIDSALSNGWTLYSHQKAAVSYLCQHPRQILALDMGLGKTIVSLVAARGHVNTVGAHVVVICPVTQKVMWRDQAALVGLDTETQVTVASWSKIPCRVDLMKKHKKVVIIADEAHNLQNLDSQRTQNFLKLSGGHTGWCVAISLLTGTPAKNGRPSNLFPLLKAVGHHLAGDQRGFESRYCGGRKTQWCPWDISGATHLKELHDRTADAIYRRTKAQCLDLPRKKRIFKECSIDDALSVDYQTLIDDMQSQKGKPSRKPKGKFAFDQITKLRHAASLAKVDATREEAQALLEQGKPVVIFVSFKDTASELHAALCRHHPVSFLTGDTPEADRALAVDQFQNGTTTVFVSTFGAGAVGITLTAAAHVILADRPWTPGDAEQAEDRVHRLGQTEQVETTWIQAFSIDKHIDSMIQKKQRNATTLFDGNDAKCENEQQTVASDMLACVLQEESHRNKQRTPFDMMRSPAAKCPRL